MRLSFICLAITIVAIPSFGDSGPVLHTENGIAHTEEEILDALAQQNSANAQVDDGTGVLADDAAALLDDRPPVPAGFDLGPGVSLKQDQQQPLEPEPEATTDAPTFVVDMSASETEEPIEETTEEPMEPTEFEIAETEETPTLLPKPVEQKRAPVGQIEYPFPPPMPQAAALKQSSQHVQLVATNEKRAQAQEAGAGQAPEDVGDTIFIAVTALCSAAAVFGLVAAGVCWYRLRKQYKAAQDAEYPQYGVTGPTKERGSGHSSPTAATDAKLAQSAQLYHYHHTKQQILSTQEPANDDQKGQDSDESDGEGDEGDYSVYECPGLAPTGDIEISNPLFDNGGSSPPHSAKKE